MTDSITNIKDARLKMSPEERLQHAESELLDATLDRRETVERMTQLGEEIEELRERLRAARRRLEVTYTPLDRAIARFRTLFRI